MQVETARIREVTKRAGIALQWLLAIFASGAQQMRIENAEVVALTN
jgi:hypothetical protein